MKTKFKRLALSAAFIAGFSLGNELAKADDKVLNDLNNICADTWCEGDYEFVFNSLKCDDTYCILKFAGWPHEDEKHRAFRTCAFSGYRGIEDFTFRTADAYETISDCVQEMEADLKEFHQSDEEIEELRKLEMSFAPLGVGERP